ncbi:lipase family protein [Mycobacterium sp. ITM-2016-00318]|uniref:lipase family protein n=1 Tax=Mycobacterium sp. ITM-2016-00318 TaxID=2099693 RepID=UPI0011571B89|nr:lipase family protein [Mycobacterium sp. ITM-2016-00318]WNG92316.1 lipase family protein [Mycobacterium sp. ITM-2016-00318]
MVLRFVQRLGSVLACAVVAACGASQPATPSSTGPEELNYTRQTPTIAAGDLAARGTVVSSSAQTTFDLSALPAGSTAHTMVYRSISGITGSPTVVSGAVFTPPGEPPPGGWPVIGYAHGTVGVTPDCGPTADSRLLGDTTAVAIQVNLGYAVAYTDYAGLGESAASSEDAATSHAYLEPKSAAFNLIDGVRAARTVVPQLSSRWVALGSSQGGETSWAAAEYFEAYGQGTDLLGAAALVPTADMSGLVQRAETSTLTNDQMFLYPNVIEGLASVDKTIDPKDYLHGVLSDEKSTLLACRPPASQGKEALAGKFTGSDAKPSSQAAADRLRERLTSYALPQQPTKIPLLAIYGGSDQTVPPEWTEVAMGRACARGDTILRVRMEGQGHKLDPGALLGQWIADRFAGVPAVGNC